MNSGNSSNYIKELYEYAIANGFDGDTFLSASNVVHYVETAVDGYRGYPLFTHVFGRNYDKKTLSRMMSVDLNSRLGILAGLSTGPEYESVMLIEPPLVHKTGMFQYLRTAGPDEYSLLLKPAMYKQEAFEKYAYEQRKALLDASTWYMYIFATKKDLQHSGYGKRIMDLILSFAHSKKYAICLETNSPDNVKMYHHFGFQTISSSMYKHALEHYVMRFPGSLPMQKPLPF